MDCEILLPTVLSNRGRAMLEAMRDAAPTVGVAVRVTKEWKRKSIWLMSYGLGHPQRRLWTQEHLKKGGRVIGWDLGYWHRDCAMRLTLDQDHPQRHLVDMPGDRWDATGFTLRNDADPAGPILLCGLGHKQRTLQGFKQQSWELGQLAAIRAAYPGRTVLYRPKRPEELKGCAVAPGSIEEALRGVSLAVVNHSNVAIDACIAGVPVVCQDGAAAALYGKDLRKPVAPSESERLRFLRNVAWWQWKPDEATEAWKFLLGQLCA